MKRPWALPLVPLYAAAVWAKARLHDRGWLRVRRLPQPVVSIGSLSAGGAGKTPVVLALAELLARHGVAVDVLSRGYGRGSSTVEQVDPAGPATRFGDEPVELARAGLRVFVGDERYLAGKLAEQTEQAAALHLLDDGFQHRRLARALDIVLLTAEDVRDSLLPAGNLREPLSALRRADVVIVREQEAQALTGVIGRYTQAVTLVVRRRLVLPATPPKHPLAFCAIARPDDFLKQLQAEGIDCAGLQAFPDHHAYTAQDMRRLLAAARRHHANGFVTTAKDAVKLTPGMLATLGTLGQVAIAQLEVSFLEERAVLAILAESAGAARLKPRP